MMPRRKQPEVTNSAGPTLRRVIKPAASVGQTMRDACCCTEFRAIALIRCSGSTRSEMSACRAGPVNDIVAPSKIEFANMCHKEMRSRSVRTASMKMLSMLTACEPMSSRRRS